MRGTHTFRTQQATQVISCHPWSTRLCPYPSPIRKMKTYLELEGKLDTQSQLQPATSTYSPDKSPLPQKTPVPKKAEKKKRSNAPIKRSFKVRVIAQPLPMNPSLPIGPTLMVITTKATLTQMSAVKPTPTTASPTSIPVTVYNLAQGKFKEFPYPAGKPQKEEGPSTPNSSNPPKVQQPKVTTTATALQTREDTPWPNTMPASTNLFVTRASWPISPNKTQHPESLKWKKQRTGPT